MYTLINCSPKIEKSNSLKFLKSIECELKDCVYKNIYKDNFDDILDSIGDKVIFALPLYVDAPPSKLLEFMDYVIDNDIILDSNFYYVINCGFREGEQNITALNILKNWTNKIGGKYSGSLLIGAGEVVGDDRYKFITKRARKNIRLFSKNIKNNNFFEMITTTDYINNKIFCFFANKFWSRHGKSNGLSVSDIRDI